MDITMRTPRTPEAAPRQMLLRLPDDLARKLAHTVAPGQRNRFLIELLRQRLGDEDEELLAACRSMNELEARSKRARRERLEWANADLAEPLARSDPEFDAARFEREFAAAQAGTDEPAQSGSP